MAARRWYLLSNHEAWQSPQAHIAWPSGMSMPSFFSAALTRHTFWFLIVWINLSTLAVLPFWYICQKMDFGICSAMRRCCGSGCAVASDAGLSCMQLPLTRTWPLDCVKGWPLSWQGYLYRGGCGWCQSVTEYCTTDPTLAMALPQSPCWGS